MRNKNLPINSYNKIKITFVCLIISETQTSLKIVDYTNEAEGTLRINTREFKYLLVVVCGVIKKLQTHVASNKRAFAFTQMNIK